MTITGTSGNDNLTGTVDPELFDLSQGGNDTASGLEGDDNFRFDGTFTRRDAIDGGDGSDQISLDGDYSVHSKLSAQTLVSVERLHLAGGHTYDLEFVDANFTGAATIYGGELDTSDALIFDASADSDTAFTIYGGAGNDVIVGGDGGSNFYLEPGGDDDVTGGVGDDYFSLGGSFDRHDKVDGKDGDDILTLDGDYSSGLTITRRMMHDVEQIFLSGAFNYDLTLKGNVIPAGGTLAVYGGIAAPQTFAFDGTLVTDSTLILYGGGGNDVLLGGALGDTISMGDGQDHGEGGDGDDDFGFSTGFSADDVLIGGAGYDRIALAGDYSAGVVLNATTMTGIEEIDFFAGHSYSLTMDDANVGNETLIVHGLLLASTESVVFDGSAETDGFFDIITGAGADILTGGANADHLNGNSGDDRLNGSLGDDVLTGGLGADRFNGGAGFDTYVISSVAQSTGATYDRELTFDAQDDVFDLINPVTGIDTKVIVGNLSTATFDADLGAAITSVELAVSHAVLFKPSGGDLAGHRFLIVEVGGGAGYQANADYVILFDHVAHIQSLSIANFI